MPSIKGYIAGSYSIYPFRIYSEVSMPEIDLGYGEEYGRAYGAGLQHLKSTTFQSYTTHAGHTTSASSLNIIEGAFFVQLPNIGAYQLWYSADLLTPLFSVAPEFAGVAFPTVYSYPLNYQLDPVVAPQTWWHDVNKTGFTPNNKQWNNHAPQLLSHNNSYHNQWVGFGIVEK